VCGRGKISQLHTEVSTYTTKTERYIELRYRLQNHVLNYEKVYSSSKDS